MACEYFDHHQTNLGWTIRNESNSRLPTIVRYLSNPFHRFHSYYVARFRCKDNTHFDFQQKFLMLFRIHFFTLAQSHRSVIQLKLFFVLTVLLALESHGMNCLLLKNARVYTSDKPFVSVFVHHLKKKSLFELKFKHNMHWKPKTIRLKHKNE